MTHIRSVTMAIHVCLSEHHFTGKERDAESGNDYFGARYYASSMGRFLSPDWSAKEEPVPYAKLDNPQTLNLYGYMRNNPLGGVDQDGHCSGDDCGKVSVTATTSGDAPLTSSNGGRTATAEGTVQYKFTYGGKPLTDTHIHEEISNKSSRDGEPEKAKLTPGDDDTGPKNGNPPGGVTDTSNISITTPFGGAEATMETSVFSKETTQTLSFKTPTGSSCSVTESRTLSNADSKGQSTDTYKIKLTSPATQQATPVKPPKTPTT
jgi:RHS repeat-associated protein